MAEIQATSGVFATKNPGNRHANRFALREAALPTGSYVASDHAEVLEGEKVTLLITLSGHVSLTSVTYYVEWSFDGTTWFRSVNVAASGATNTLTSNENVKAISGDDSWADTFEVQAPYVRVSVKAGGTINAAERVAIDAIALTE